MRAAFISALNEPFEVRDDFEVTEPGPGEVKIRIHASGVCHSDLSMQNGTLPHPLPAVAGHEGAGEVIAIGDGVTNVAPGDHVIVSWVPSCGSCFNCVRGETNLCQTFLLPGLANPKFSTGGTPVVGFAGTGTFAEEMVTRAEGAIKIDPDVPLDVASLIGCGVMTGVGAALNTARVEPGSNVVVFGCGGVGISVIQGARICGASNIVAVDTVGAKLEMAKRFGATHAVAPGELAELQNALTEQQGFDYAFEVVGRSETIRAAWDATRRGGTTVVVGAGSMTDMVSFSAFELFYPEKKLIGSWYGTAEVRRDFPRLLGLWRQGKLDLEGMISKRIDLAQINDALDAMKKGEVIRTVIEFK